MYDLHAALRYYVVRSNTGISLYYCEPCTCNIEERHQVMHSAHVFTFINTLVPRRFGTQFIVALHSFSLILQKTIKNWLKTSLPTVTFINTISINKYLK